MAKIDEIVSRFTPNPDVTYTAVIMNARGFKRAQKFSPPLTLHTNAPPGLHAHLCDVFARRNTNRTQLQGIASWSRIIDNAVKRNVKEGSIGISAAWGSNFLGAFTIDTQMTMLEAQHNRWGQAGIKVTGCGLVDSMSFGTPDRVEQTVSRIKEKWPDIRNFNLHMHNARNTAMAAIYAAMRVLGPEDSLILDGSIGGIGGCPYCGNGQATGSVPTEDLLHMFEGMGIDTGVDIDKLIDCVWMAERILGKSIYGHVSKAGPRPTALDQFFDINMPFVETMEHAKHFKKGPIAYEGAVTPYKSPIESPYRERVEQGLSPYDPEQGEFPWKKYNITE